MKLRRLFAHENAGFLRCELTQAQAAGRHVLGVSRGKGAFTTQRALASNAQACTPRRKLSASRSGILDRSLHTRERGGAPCRQSRTRRKRARNVTQPATQRTCAHAPTPRGKTFCLLKRYFGMVPAHKRARLGSHTTGSVLPDGNVLAT